MSSLAAQHPDDGLLLKYIDGELPPRKTRQVARHLEACWQCRTEIEDLEATVARSVRYRRNVLAAHLPPPPQPWRDLTPEFEGIDASWRGQPWLERMLSVFRGPSVRPWAIAATAVAVLIGIYWKFQQTPTVEAAALLKRAIAAQQSRPAKVHHIQVRTRTRKFTRTVGVQRRAAASDPAAADLEMKLASANYDWQDPLSAKTFEDWRDGLPSKHDEVTTDTDSYRIQTTTREGDLASASLVLRQTDLQPLEARLEFRDQEWIEFSEITDAPTRDDAPPAVTSVEPPMRLTEPSRLAATPSRAALISEELQVLAALHGIGADLGDPVEVVLAEGKVRVGGIGIPAARQAEIQKQLSGMPDVMVHFSEPAAAPEAPADTNTTAAPASGGGAPSAIRTRLEQQLGSRTDFARFSSYLLDRNEALMARAYALRALAQRFPAANEAGLSDSDRRTLRDIAHDHAAALGRELATIERLVQPVLTAIGGSASVAAVPQGADWQSSAEQLFQACRRVEVLLSRVLGVSTVEGATDRLASDLLTALTQQNADLEHCQALLQ